ncbi:MAG: dynamin family protein [Ktedonobacterales bacterium]
MSATQSWSPNFSESNAFTQFQQRRATLLRTIDRVAAIYSALDLKTATNNLNQLRQRVVADSFKVMIAGEFNRGKSTTINAMLGQKVLPAYSVPTTAIINEVKWGETPSARLYDLPPQTGGAQRVVDIPVDQIEEYVVAKESGNPYEKVEIFWPLDLCRDGVELIDSPGLNADPTHQQITLDYLTRADGIVFVIAADFPVSIEEKRMIEAIRDMRHEDIFFVVNRINVIDADEVERVKTRCLSLLAPLTARGAKGVYFIDARGALQARLAHDEPRAEASGEPALERDLKAFLGAERGRVKLVRPAHETQMQVSRAREEIVKQEKLLRTRVEDLKARYDRAQEPLRQLELSREQMIRLVDNFRHDLQSSVMDATSLFYRDMADRIPGWTAEYQPAASMNVLNMLSREKKEQFVGDIVGHLTKRLSDEAKRWQEQTLIPLVQTRVQDTLLPRLQRQVEDFDQALSAIEDDLTAGDTLVAVSPDSQALSIGNIPLWERVVAAAGGFLLGDLVSAGMGAYGGFKTMLANLGIQVGIVLGTVLLTGGFSLVVIVPAVLASAAFQLWFRNNQMSENMKSKVGEEFATRLNATRDELVRKTAAAVDTQIEKLRDALANTLATELQSLREQVESALAEKQRGQQEVDAKLRQLDPLRADLNACDQELDTLVSAYALQGARL